MSRRWIAAAAGITILAVVALFPLRIALGLSDLDRIGFTARQVEGSIWSLPVAAGLLLTPVTVWLTARADVGNWLVRHGFFVSPADQQRLVQAPAEPIEPLFEPSFAFARR